MTTFQELGIRPALCDVLRSHGIKEATPVQEKAMPLVRAGHDCIVKAQTGTGKTQIGRASCRERVSSPV